MLKHRILTASILIPLTLLGLFLLSSPAFCVISGLIFLLAAWEWANLMNLKSVAARILYICIVAFFFIWSLFIPLTYLFFLALIWWLLAILLIMAYPKGSEWWSRGIVPGIMGILVLLPSWAAINYIRNQKDGIYALLFLFVLIWGADSFAYFIGRKWGKHKIVPAVSPGKTWQGLGGGLMGGVLISILALAIFQVPFALWPFAIALSIVTIIFSLIGDLLESMMKRKVGVKDSGRFLPGHGGLLDRIDSLTAAAPIFVVGGLILGMLL